MEFNVARKKGPGWLHWFSVRVICCAHLPAISEGTFLSHVKKNWALLKERKKKVGEKKKKEARNE